MIVDRCILLHLLLAIDCCITRIIKIKKDAGIFICDTAYVYKIIQNITYGTVMKNFTVCTTRGSDLGHLLQGGEAYVKFFAENTHF